MKLRTLTEQFAYVSNADITDIINDASTKLTPGLVKKKYTWYHLYAKHQTMINFFKEFIRMCMIYNIGPKNVLPGQDFLEFLSKRHNIPNDIFNVEHYDDTELKDFKKYRVVNRYIKLITTKLLRRSISEVFLPHILLTNDFLNYEKNLTDIIPLTTFNKLGMEKQKEIKIDVINKIMDSYKDNLDHKILSYAIPFFLYKRKTRVVNINKKDINGYIKYSDTIFTLAKKQFDIFQQIIDEVLRDITPKEDWEITHTSNYLVNTLILLENMVKNLILDINKIDKEAKQAVKKTWSRRLQKKEVILCSGS